MSYIVVDVEADGPCPGKYSMVCFGAVLVDDKLSNHFYGKTAPISHEFIPEALAVSGFTRMQHRTFNMPEAVMKDFAEWIRLVSPDKPVFISDNPAFDWQFINYYFHTFHTGNPFGYSARRIGDIYCGLMKDAGLNAEWKKKYRITRHTHNPVDDALGNAEALIAFKTELGLKIDFSAKRFTGNSK